MTESRKSLKPVEYLAFAGVIAVFAAFTVLLSTRDLVLAGIFGIIFFIGTLVVVSTVMIAVKPKSRASADLDKREGFEP